MANPKISTVQALGQFIRYDPDSGILYWRHTTAEQFPDGKGYAERTSARWNRLHAGRPATGTQHDQGYIRIGVRGRVYYAHVLAWALTAGSWPAASIDHINGDPSDNRLANLREVSHQANMRNQPLRSNNTSGVMGVTRNGSGWLARIGRQSLGTFKDFDAAVAARRAAEQQHGYHANHGRNRERQKGHV